MAELTKTKASTTSAAPPAKPAPSAKAATPAKSVATADARIEQFLTGQVTKLSDAIQFPPDAAQGFVRLSAALFQAERFHAAEIAAELAVHLDHTLAAGWHLFGAAHARQENFEAAANAYRQVVGLTPKNVSAWCDLGEALIESGDMAAAGDALKQAMQLDAEAKTPHGRRARALVARTLAQLRR